MRGLVRRLHLLAKLNSTIDHWLDSVRLYRLRTRALDDVEDLGRYVTQSHAGPL